MAVARRVIVHGRVQGVFFRDTVRRAAQRSGVTGWAENRSDGTVAVHLEGEEADVERVLDACRSGPRGAEVERVEVSDAEPEHGSSFATR